MKCHRQKPGQDARVALWRLSNCRGDHIECGGVPGCQQVQGGPGCPVPAVATIEVRGAEKGARRRHVRVLGL